MSRFTIKNLMDVEDSVAGRAPGMKGRSPASTWDVVRVSPETVRAFEGGEDGIELIAVGSDRPEGGDGVMAPTAWVDEPEAVA